ncbi:hypothetical protein SPJ221_200 [Staphylococcus phage vB_SauH_SPJ2]|uniref:Uncharacterized protein n=1 Tax=Staphylococcus phage SA11 TaxID=2927988 RepID=I7DJS1_9CAUD|nr:TreN-like membrane protein [Staphylococcus phage SA11]QQO38026.1 hypothetical protein LSA2308_00005 [Staphylococcus phage LSA2308]USZ62827.1 hypothetical protein LSA2311_orf00019 [Staphylococcus phage LSA2311]WEW53566.1 hypothetical protein SPJ221_17 [Staphylococcus phage vB_SauH_SPJ2]BBI90141.1 hypothetical protein MRS_024 [Staphylococcus phage MR003]AFO70610.1 hypothetical protein [Staphylococcus phage SA11]
MIKVKYKGKKYRSTQNTDAIVTILGGTAVITLIDWFIRLQENINIFIR